MAVILREFIIVGFLTAFGAIFNGYVLSVLWGWFVVPTFGAHSLGIVPAIGISMVASYLTHQPRHASKKEEQSFSDTIIEGIGMAVLEPSFALLFGWIVHLFM